MSRFIIHSDRFHVQILSIQSSFIDTGNRIEEVIIILLYISPLYFSLLFVNSCFPGGLFFWLIRVCHFYLHFEKYHHWVIKSTAWRILVQHGIFLLNLKDNGCLLSHMCCFWWESAAVLSHVSFHILSSFLWRFFLGIK